MAQQDRFLSIGEVAKLTRRSEATVRRQIKDGSGPTFFRLGATWRTRMSEVERWLAANAVGGPPKHVAPVKRRPGRPAKSPTSHAAV